MLGGHFKSTNKGKTRRRYAFICALFAWGGRYKNICSFYRSNQKALQENKQLCCWYWCSSSGHTCGATVVSGWTVGLAKSLAIVGVKSNLAFFHSLTGRNKTSFLFGRGKRLVSFPAVTGYFVKMNSPWKATYKLPLHHWTIHHNTVW